MPVLILGEDFSSIGYVAPTVYELKGGTPGNWRYYSSLPEAMAAYIDPSTVNAAGTWYFNSTAQPETFGINVDFWTLVNGKWTFVDYQYMKDNGSPSGVIRFYLPDGSGLYYAVFNNKYFGITATVVNDYSSDKIAALDAFYREAALLKYRYNALVGFLNYLAKKVLTPTEQQVYNEGLLKLQTMNGQISFIQGLEISYGNQSAIGLPILLIIAIIAIISAATAWTVNSILTEQQKTKRINDSYDLAKWIADKKTQLAQMVSAGTITQTQASAINSTLDQAAASGNAIAMQSSKPTTSIFDQVTSLVKWGIVGVIAWQGLKFLNRPKHVNNG